MSKKAEVGLYLTKKLLFKFQVTKQHVEKAQHTTLNNKKALTAFTERAYYHLVTLKPR